MNYKKVLLPFARKAEQRLRGAALECGLPEEELPAGKLREILGEELPPGESVLAAWLTPEGELTQVGSRAIRGYILDSLIREKARLEGRAAELGGLISHLREEVGA